MRHTMCMSPRNPLISLSLPKIANFRIGNAIVPIISFRMGTIYLSGVRMDRVFFAKAEYDYAVLKSVVFKLIDSISGDSIRKGMKVLIKPNLLIPAKPESAVITHPLVVKAAAEYVLDKGGIVTVSDSPAVGLFGKILKDGGYRKAFEGLDVQFREFKETVKRDIGEPFGSIEIAR
ncbi:MAG: DUF362 domain-containing protein, partial [Desulfobacteraceae bacterium]